MPLLHTYICIQAAHVVVLCRTSHRPSDSASGGTVNWLVKRYSWRRRRRATTPCALRRARSSVSSSEDRHLAEGSEAKTLPHIPVNGSIYNDFGKCVTPARFSASSNEVLCKRHKYSTLLGRQQRKRVRRASTCQRVWTRNWGWAQYRALGKNDGDDVRVCGCAGAGTLRGLQESQHGAAHVRVNERRCSTHATRPHVARRTRCHVLLHALRSGTLLHV